MLPLHIMRRHYTQLDEFGPVEFVRLERQGYQVCIAMDKREASLGEEIIGLRARNQETAGNATGHHDGMRYCTGFMFRLVGREKCSILYEVLYCLNSAGRSHVPGKRLSAKEHCVLFQVTTPGRSSQPLALAQTVNLPVAGRRHAAHNGNCHTYAFRIKLPN